MGKNKTRAYIGITVKDKDGFLKRYNPKDKFRLGIDKTNPEILTYDKGFQEAYRVWSETAKKNEEEADLWKKKYYTAQKAFCEGTDFILNNFKQKHEQFVSELKENIYNDDKGYLIGLDSIAEIIENLDKKIYGSQKQKEVKTLSNLASGDTKQGGINSQDDKKLQNGRSVSLPADTHSVNKTEQKVGVSKNNSTPAQSNSKDKKEVNNEKNINN
jgi:hypothetical protein